MKTFFYSITTLALVSIAYAGFSQTVNWRSLQPAEKHILNINTGWDYSTTFGIAYGRSLQTKMPVIIGGEFSIPAGHELVDDLKTKIGAQAEVFTVRSFSATLKVQGIFRRFESQYVRLANFGSELSTALGYYRPRWYAAAEFGFDKSIITHFKHGGAMKEYYPEIQDGWYIPTGGNFFYGLQVGYSLKNYDMYLKGGQTVAQDFKTTAAIPFFLNVGFNKRF